jgi:hypothetical protein
VRAPVASAAAAAAATAATAAVSAAATAGYQAVRVAARALATSVPSAVPVGHLAHPHPRPMPVQLRGAPRRLPLRLATLNVAGRLAANTTTLAHLAVDHGVDVLALQEVKLGGRAVSRFVQSLNDAAAARAAERRRHHSGFCVKAAPNVAAVKSAGVILLFRKALCSSGDLELQGEAHSDFDWGGRMVSATVKWRGHTLQLVSTYCPNDSGPRAAFISSAVAAAWQRRP